MKSAFENQSKFDYNQTFIQFATRSDELFEIQQLGYLLGTFQAIIQQCIKKFDSKSNQTLIKLFKSIKSLKVPKNFLALSFQLSTLKPFSRGDKSIDDTA